jgi:hypothetical protein
MLGACFKLSKKRNGIQGTVLKHTSKIKLLDIAQTQPSLSGSLSKQIILVSTSLVALARTKSPFPLV